MSARAQLGYSPILADYVRRTPRSAAAYERAQRVLAGGNTRQSVFWSPYPLTVTRGAGYELWDVDGNRYIDLLNNYTALVHGHAYGPIVKAVERQLQRGSCWSANAVAPTTLAERICERVASVDQLRFTNSGTEAANLALTIARTVTGRDKVLMAHYGYHGSLLEFESGHTDRPWSLTLLADYNDAASFERALAQHGEEIAAVFLEPVLGAGGIVPAEPAFLESVISATHDAGAVFVLDEVMTFRLATGGLQQELGITPDLTMFGKCIGGGHPVGAVGGHRELMQIFAPPAPEIFHGGTFNGNPITMVAGEVCVRELTDARIRRMARLAERLHLGLEDSARAVGLPLTVSRMGSLMNLYFSDEAPSPSEHREADSLLREFHLAALNHGLFIAPRGLLALSTVITTAVIDEVLERARAAMGEVAAAVA